MIPKPKNSALNDTTWERLSFWQRLDQWISSWMPGWIIALSVSLFFAAITTAVVCGVIAFAAWDVSWLWGVTARAIFGSLTALFYLVIWRES